MERLLRRIRWGYLLPQAAWLAVRLRFETQSGVPALPPCAPVRTGRPSPRFVARAVRLATPGARCLVRSVVLARMLRRYGYPAAVVIGLPETSAGPPASGAFAHAWVELENSSGCVGYEELGRIEA